MIAPVALPGGAILRPVADGDAPALLDAFRRNRDHLAPWDPIRPDAFYTLEGQHARLNLLLRLAEDGDALGCAIFRAGRVLGNATLNSIVRGVVGGAHLGYWVDAGSLRQGLATAAVAAMCRIAEEDLGLHRVEASTAPANSASQAVLRRNGFEQFGYAHRHLYIAGRWGDGVLFEKILNDRPPPPL